MTDPAFQPLCALANKIAGKELSSAELLDHYITRIERHNPKLNAIVAMDLDRARDAAAEADRALADGGAVGPLHGVPMTIKDAYEVEGLVSTGGVPALRDHVPAKDALSVSRLRQAGAVIVGKTNVPAYSGDWQSSNEIYGTTKNPWNQEHTPGGSSGGAAGRRLGRPDRRRDRQRHRRVDPPAGPLLRSLRPQAELRRGAHARPYPARTGRL